MDLKQYYKVTNRGKKITQAKTWEDQKNVIEQIIYYYEGKHYIEIRNNGFLLLFHEMIGG